MWAVAVPCSFLWVAIAERNGTSGPPSQLRAHLPSGARPWGPRIYAEAAPTWTRTERWGGAGVGGDRERRAPQAFPCLACSSPVTPCGRRPHPASTKAQEPHHREAPIGYQTELRADPPLPRGERWGCPVGWADSPRRRRCAGTGRRTGWGKGLPADRH